MVVTSDVSALDRSISSARKLEKSEDESAGSLVPSAQTTFFTLSLPFHFLTSLLRTFPLRVSMPVSSSKLAVDAASSAYAVRELPEIALFTTGTYIPLPVSATAMIAAAVFFIRFFSITTSPCYII